MTCKDCIHEKVCDALIKSGCPYLDEEVPADAFCMEFRNTADVVPKSEVERLEHILNSYALQYGTVKDQHEVIDKAKSEVAKEIFEEIDGITELFAKGLIEELEMYDKLAELKKKYTGEKECPNCRYFVGCECFDGKTCDEYEEKKE